MAKKDEKFYWLKLDRHFFDRHDIKIIKSMPNGKDYLIFYLQLLCESIDHSGELRLSDTIPYNEEMLASLTNTNIDIVRSAVKLFTSLNMMELQDNHTIFMTQMEKMIGSESYWAERKRISREEVLPEPKDSEFLVEGEENVGNCPTNVQQMSNSSLSISNSISNTLDISNTNNKEKEIHKEKEMPTNVICIGLNDILKSIKSTYAKYEYNTKFHKTATAKKIKSLLLAKEKNKKLYPLQIILAYNNYLSQKFEEETEANFIKGSEVFLTSEVYDYAEKTNSIFLAKMQEKYGDEWQKLKFEYKEE